jgi:hypothetical protein
LHYGEAVGRWAWRGGAAAFDTRGGRTGAPAGIRGELAEGFGGGAEPVFSLAIGKISAAAEGPYEQGSKQN